MKKYKLTDNISLSELLDDITVNLGRFTHENYKEIKDSLLTVEYCSQTRKYVTMSEETARWALQNCKFKANATEEEWSQPDDWKEGHAILYNELLNQIESVE